jgi:hypothetical protein
MTPGQAPAHAARGAVLLPEQLPGLPPSPRPAESEQVPAAAPLVSRSFLLVGTSVAVTGVWGAVIWLSLHVVADSKLTSVALFVHLAALVAGFGAVLVVDWVGALWLLGRRALVDVLALARTCHAVIWAGLALLSLSGALLNPDLSALRTQVKLGLVLVLALNGVQAIALQSRLDALRGTPSRALLAWSSASALVSQAGWWTATLIGFLTHQSH